MCNLSHSVRFIYCFKWLGFSSVLLCVNSVMFCVFDFVANKMYQCVLHIFGWIVFVYCIPSQHFGTLYTMNILWHQIKLAALWLNSTDKCLFFPLFLFLPVSRVLVAVCSGLCLKLRGSGYLSNCFWLPAFKHITMTRQTLNPNCITLIVCQSCCMTDESAQAHMHIHTVFNAA